MTKLKYCLYLFGPISLGYILPLFVYEWPISIRTADGVQGIHPTNLGLAILASLVWYGIAITIIASPYCLIIRHTPARPWTGTARWVGFFTFSLGGAVIALGQRLVLLPLYQVFHQLSFLPAIGFILGVVCWQELRGKKGTELKKLVVVSLMGLDLVSLFAVPIIFGFTGLPAMSAVALLFGMAVIRVRPVRQLAAFGLFTLILLGGLSIKNEVRLLMCDGFCELVPLESFFQKDKPVEVATNTELAQEPTAPRTHRLLRALNTPSTPEVDIPAPPPVEVLPSTKEVVALLETQKQAFVAGQDTNYATIRILPIALHDSVFHYFVARVLHRLNRLGELAYIIQTTGEEVPFAKGHTYVPLLTKVIPRFLWEEKPKELFGQYFGHRYRFLDEKDFFTSFNLPFIVEGYMNWGWWGILFSSILVGIVVRLFWDFLIGGRQEIGNVMLGMVVLVNLVLQSSNLSMMMGGTFYGVVVYWLLDVVFRKAFRSNDTASMFAPDKAPRRSYVNQLKDLLGNYK